MQRLANALRVLAVDMVKEANSGHPGLPMGMADVMTILCTEFLAHIPTDPKWVNRDRLVLSAGHGSAMLYSILYLLGYHINIGDLMDFRNYGSRTPGHPEYGVMEGVEATTGPLGQGIANGIGMAIASKAEQAGGNSKIALRDYKIYIIAGDGCLMEGIAHEAISLAGHLGLNNVVLLFDDNGISIDGPTSLATSEKHAEVFAACGWDVAAIDGHDYGQIRTALQYAQTQEKPLFIACKTIIGYGSPNHAGTERVHGAVFSEEEMKLIRHRLNWPHPKFVVPDDILEVWRRSWHKYEEQWDADLDMDPIMPMDLENRVATALKATNTVFDDIKFAIDLRAKPAPTRKLFGDIMEALLKSGIPLIGGSADLSPSNNTYTKHSKVIMKHAYDGNYIHYGVREHAMGAIMNGIALHGRYIPYGGTFLAFTDYMRPSIRLAALMGLRCLFIATHDSLWLGEDGPTHQPVEHLASFRAMPCINVFRPCDATEISECLQLAITGDKKPSLLLLTRQSVPSIRKEYVQENMSGYGAYIIQHSEAESAVRIFASGSEVSIAIEVAALLSAQENILVDVVSVPELMLFSRQSEDYVNKITGAGKFKVVIEAATKAHWQDVMGSINLFVTIDNFGHSGSISALQENLGFKAANIANKIKLLLNQ